AHVFAGRAGRAAGSPAIDALGVERVLLRARAGTLIGSRTGDAHRWLRSTVRARSAGLRRAGLMIRLSRREPVTRASISSESVLEGLSENKMVAEILYERHESVVKLMVFARWGSGGHNGRMGMRPGTRGECCEDPGMSRSAPRGLCHSLGLLVRCD